MTYALINQPIPPIIRPRAIRGRFGFDVGIKVLGACREVSQSRKSKAEFVIIAKTSNDAFAYADKDLGLRAA